MSQGQSESIEEWLGEDPLHELHQVKIERAESGKTLIDLSMVNPDLPVSQDILDRMLEASVKPSNSRYSVSRGIRKLRSAFADKYEQRYSVQLDPERDICVTMGAKDALFQLLFSLRLKVPPGKALLPGPAYPAHYAALMLGGYDIEVLPEFDAEDAFLKQIEARFKDGVQLCIFNYPQNPSGKMISEDFVRGLVALSRQYHVTIIHDFAYGEFCYRQKPLSFLSCSETGDEVYEIYSLSKTYSVPGWRVASLAGRGSALPTFIKVKSHLDYGLFLPIQHAAAYALSLDDDTVQEMKEEYRYRAQSLVQGLQRIGWKTEMPDGGCSVWAQYPQGLLPDSSIEAALVLLKKYGIAVLPGEYFVGAKERYLRFALVKPQEVLQRVISLLEGITISEERHEVA